MPLHHRKGCLINVSLFIFIYFVLVYCQQLKNILVNLCYVTYFIENNNMINIIFFFMIKQNLFISAIKIKLLDGVSSSAFTNFTTSGANEMTSEWS